MTCVIFVFHLALNMHVNNNNNFICTELFDSETVKGTNVRQVKDKIDI